ncbi:hypothetical protein FDG2_5210 [Candidatus Protofrankia californiensis]|uniref:Arc-like DNA binding domain-containing protein n=1 Tax=Candidatus Protofrankia californiensis TaxID=1839754 RepID=A0A1C3PBJ8_9ACTN|nr:hypothetical protein FDG2_5210 [Candidatus Protofrankia californiensis]
MTERKKILLRLDPAVHDALARWATAELRSTNAQIEFLLRRALSDAGRLPGNVGCIPRRGRPSKPEPAPGNRPEPDPGATSEPISGPTSGPTSADGPGSDRPESSGHGIDT